MPRLCAFGVRYNGDYVTGLSLPNSAATVPVYSRNPPLLLWSTNTWFKYRIQQDFFGGVHYVWCSPEFEGAKLGKYALSSSQPPSSDPCTIYRQLKHAVSNGDEHDPKIESQRNTLSALAQSYHAENSISDLDRDEILAMIAKSTVKDWRPLIFVIPFATVSGRVELVARSRRASHEPEYIIKDLSDGEFRIIEPDGVS